MKQLIILLSTIFCMTFSFSAQVEKKDTFGSSFELGANTPVTVSEALVSAKKRAIELEKEFVLVGKVQKVCKKKGCWMTLGPDSAEVTLDQACANSLTNNIVQKDLRMTFKDYGFYVPKNLEGKVIAKGVLKKEKLSEKSAKHYLKDMGCSKKHYSNLNGSFERFSFVASGVKKISERKTTIKVLPATSKM